MPLIKEKVGNRFRWYFPSLILILLIIGVSSSFYIYRAVTETSKASLVSRASTISSALSSGGVTLLLGNENDLENSSYLKLKKQMVQILEANPDSRFVYLMGQRFNNLGEKEVFFFVDSEPSDSEDYSPPGQVYFEESEAIDLALNHGIAGVEGPTSDRWGTWITGIAPIIDEDERVVGLVGIDVDAISYRNRALALASIPFIIALSLIIFVYFGGKLRKREAELLALKEQFVALATHEIRSPLTGIVWALSQFFKKENIQGSELAPLAKASSKLLESVNDILFSFSLETNISEKRPVEISKIIDASLQSLRSYGEKKNIKIIYDKESAEIMGDERRLEHVFTNLISNAIKYSPEGSEVGIREYKNKKEICIEIIDHGIGIPKEDIDKVFAGFFRAKNAIAHAETGTGLGLYIAKNVVTDHKGTISIDSDVDQGTKVRICLPLL